MFNPSKIWTGTHNSEITIRRERVNFEIQRMYMSDFMIELGNEKRNDKIMLIQLSIQKSRRLFF